MVFTVNLSYFKKGGKWYADGSYETDTEQLWEIWKEVRGMAYTKRLPGLMAGHSDFHVVIDVPGHPYNHPHMIPISSYEDGKFLGI